MEDTIKEMAPPMMPAAPVAIESIASPIPDLLEPPNNNLRDAGIVILVIVAAAVCAKLYQATSRK